MKHLKSCSQVNVNRAAAKENRTCGICNKTFAKKSNRDRHIQIVHYNVDDNDADDDLIIKDEDFPSMAFNNLSNAMSPPPHATLPKPSTAIVTAPPSNAIPHHLLHQLPPLPHRPLRHHPPPLLCHPPLCCLMKCPHERAFGVNWLLVIIKSYVKFNFKERNNNNTPAALSVPSTATITLPSVTASVETSSRAFAEQTLDDSTPLAQ